MEAADPDTMLEAAVEAGAEDAETGDGVHEVTTAVEDFAAVRDALEARFGAPESAKLEWLPAATVDLDEERARDVLKLVDALDESDDVQTVYANFEVAEAVMQRLSA
jgi:transcriptional/translational regulatory protein YebC/TACO1